MNQEEQDAVHQVKRLIQQYYNEPTAEVADAVFRAAQRLRAVWFDGPARELTN